MGTREHKEKAPKFAKVGIISMSSTRSVENDESGIWIRNQLIKKGKQVVLHDVIPDDAKIIISKVKMVIDEFKPEILLLTGGTGIGGKDVTIEAIRPVFNKELTAFGFIFSFLSYKEIGSAVILSRATAGIIGNTIVFCMPGSLKACQLACNSIIFPEIGHLIKHMGEK